MKASRLKLSLIVATLSLTAGAASAQPKAPMGPPVDMAEPASQSEWTQRDWIMAPLLGSIAGGGAAFGLGYLGYQVDGHCLDSVEDCAPVVTAVSLYSGLIFGASSAVALYGQSRGHDGSFRAALIGALIGNVGSGLPIVLSAKILGDDLGPPVVLAALVAGPAIGATIAYRISHGIRQGRQKRLPRSGALIDFDGSSASLGVPALALGVKDGDLSVYAPLAGGTF